MLRDITELLNNNVEVEIFDLTDPTAQYNSVGVYDGSRIPNEWLNTYVVNIYVDENKLCVDVYRED